LEAEAAVRRIPVTWFDRRESARPVAKRLRDKPGCSFVYARGGKNMSVHHSVGREIVKGTGMLAIHLAAVVVGAILMFAGIGLGVGLVTLPAAIPVGFAGLFVFLWGLFGRSEEKEPPTNPSA
jgi:hypothetical protein